MTPYTFADRHIGPRDGDIPQMLEVIGEKTLEDLIDKVIPPDIRLDGDFDIPALQEDEYLRYLKKIASQNKLFRTYIGLGYYNTVFPAVIQRNILENPSWYTSYTPYQAEISQGRLEALLNFQTVIMELTGLPLANSSLLDEGTSAAEAMLMLYNARSRSAVKENVNRFFVDEDIFPQTWSILKTRAEARKIELVKGSWKEMTPGGDFFGALVQYPGAGGQVCDYEPWAEKARENGVPVVVVADILSLALLRPPGEWGADVVVGSVQRLGLPVSYGGPHAGYMAAKEEYKRHMPGRIIGVTHDAQGKPALRMALQTREQHIKRERATSNICTAQALLATMAGMYAVYHGPGGLKKIAGGIHALAGALNETVKTLGYDQVNDNFFDTLRIRVPEEKQREKIRELALQKEINLNFFEPGYVGVSLDESVNAPDLQDLADIFAGGAGKKSMPVQTGGKSIFLDKKFLRKTPFLQQAVFHKYRSETEMMRYIKKLERRDISLTHSMISLGSCTMKLNAAVEMLAVTWMEFGALHPFVPADQAAGYGRVIRDLEEDLLKVTGFAGITFQPNSGAAGEYTGLSIIRKYLQDKGQGERNVVLIPSSAHGTNPASAVMAGMKVVVVECDDRGNISVDSLRRLAEEHKERLAAFMVTYPSTHGVFESRIKEMTEIVHSCGGQVYMDGANMNAQVGLTSPAEIGADVCHLNLHKTFAIPHGGGGPGVGPVAVAEHLKDYLPGHPLVPVGGDKGNITISAAPYGSAHILVISHAYMRLMGSRGLKKASEVAILNANYLSRALQDHFKTLYTGETGYVGHEMILDCREFKQTAGISEADIAKRLMDYGFHAPTLSFPVHGTLMVEPTESESKAELDRFVETMKQIHAEIMEVQNGEADAQDNVLKNAPHTQETALDDTWSHPYSRSKAVFPLPWIAENKFWPAVNRVDDAWGDRHLMCSVDGLEHFPDEEAG